MFLRIFSSAVIIQLIKKILLKVLVCVCSVFGKEDKMIFLKYLAIFVFLYVAVDGFPTKDQVDHSLNLTVVHINDIHAHFEGEQC